MRITLVTVDIFKWRISKCMWIIIQYFYLFCRVFDWRTIPLVYTQVSTTDPVTYKYIISITMTRAIGAGCDICNVYICGGICNWPPTCLWTWHANSRRTVRRLLSVRHFTASPILRGTIESNFVLFKFIFTAVAHLFLYKLGLMFSSISFFIAGCREHGWPLRYVEQLDDEIGLAYYSAVTYEINK